MPVFVYLVEVERADGRFGRPDDSERSPSEILDLVNDSILTPLIADRFSPNFGSVPPNGHMMPAILDDISAPPMLRFDFRSDVVKRPSKKALEKMVADRIAKLLHETDGEEVVDGRDLHEMVLNEYETTAPAQSQYGTAIVLKDWRSATRSDNSVAIVIQAPDCHFANDMVDRIVTFVWRETVTLRSLFLANVIPLEDCWDYVGNYSPAVSQSDLVRTAHAVNAGGLDGFVGRLGNLRLSLYFSDSVKFEVMGDEDQDSELEEAVIIKASDPSLSETFERLIEDPKYAVTKAAFDVKFEPVDDDDHVTQHLVFEVLSPDKQYGGVKCKSAEDYLSNKDLALAFVGARWVNQLFVGLEVVRGAPGAHKIHDFDHVPSSEDGEEADE